MALLYKEALPALVQQVRHDTHERLGTDAAILPQLVQVQPELQFLRSVEQRRRNHTQTT